MIVLFAYQAINLIILIWNIIPLLMMSFFLIVVVINIFVKPSKKKSSQNGLNSIYQKGEREKPSKKTVLIGVIVCVITSVLFGVVGFVGMTSEMFLHTPKLLNVKTSFGGASAIQS